MWYNKKIDKDALIGENVAIHFIKLVLLGYSLYLTYILIYIPLKVMAIDQRIYDTNNGVAGTLLYIFSILIIFKLADLCSDRIVDNRDLIECANIEERELNEILAECD